MKVVTSVAVVPTTVHVELPFVERSSLYPVSPVTSTHARLIWVADTTVAVRPVGERGRPAAVVVALAVAEGAESPELLLATTRYV